MQVILPVAGVGTRLRPLTHTLPKVLLPVADKPIIGHIVQNLLDSGVDDLVFVVGYKGDLIEQYITENFQGTFTFVTQAERRGLGHSIWVTKEFITSDELFIVLGDTIFDVDLSEFVGTGKNILGAKRVEDPRRFGVAETNENGVVTALVEKPEQPKSDMALVGLYSIQQASELFAALDHIVDNDITTRGEYQLTDALQYMIEHGTEFQLQEIDGWYDCGKSDTLLETNRHLLNNGCARRSEGSVVRDSHIIEPCYIHATAQIERSVIGPHVSVGPGVKISDSNIDDAIIAGDTEIESVRATSTLIGKNCSVKGAVLSTILGDDSSLYS